MGLRVVNVIPAVLSDETRQDSEASVTANPLDPSQIALAAFTPDPAQSGMGPIFVSTDGGETWALNVCVPGGNRTDDISLRFGGATGRLYAAILRKDTGNMQILRAASFPPARPLTVLVDRAGPDQPWVECVVGRDRDGTAQDRVYVSANMDTAVAQYSLDGASAATQGGFGRMHDLESRAGNDRPSVRTAVHRSGSVYGAFIGVRDGRSDIVLVRDDAWGAGRWTALVDPEDGKVGRRVVTGVITPPAGSQLGTVRVSSRLALAVDPADDACVYLAWCDGAATPDSPFTLHLARSDDAGKTWTGDLRTVKGVTNPALAVNVRGTVGLLYQQLKAPADGARWETHLEISDDRFATVRDDMVAANLRDRGDTFQPTIGDYTTLVAVGKDFHGAFCGFNRPSAANFPFGVKYGRNVDWDKRQLLGSDGATPRSPSIDPFYLHFSDIPQAAEVYVRRWPADTGLEPAVAPVLWAESDVWNHPRRSTDGARNEPSARPASNGAGDEGENLLFARVSRWPSEKRVSATARFLIARLGIGCNFVDPPGATKAVASVTFAARASHIVTSRGCAWRLDATESAHVRVAVEVAGETDALARPSVRGRAPGWPGRSFELSDDNNRAQRNLVLATAPSGGSGSAAVGLFALVHNAATDARDVEIAYALGGLLRRAPGGVYLEAQGKRRRRAGARGSIVLAGMAPGESRWLGASFRVSPGQRGEVTAIDFAETVRGIPIDGMRLGVRLGTKRDTLLHTLERLRSVLTRLEALGITRTADEVESARAAIRRPTHTDRWIRGLDARWETLSSLLTQAADARDGVHVRAALRRTRAALRTTPEAGLVTLLGALERADMALTLRQLATGDRADIAQTVRRQLELLDGTPAFAGTKAATTARRLTAEFLDADDHGGQADDASYLRFIGAVVPALESLKPVDDRRGLDALVANLREAAQRRDVAEMQGAHRAVLDHLQAAGTSST